MTRSTPSSASRSSTSRVPAQRRGVRPRRLHAGGDRVAHGGQLEPRGRGRSRRRARARWRRSPACRRAPGRRRARPRTWRSSRNTQPGEGGVVERAVGDPRRQRARPTVAGPPGGHRVVAEGDVGGQQLLDVVGDLVLQRPGVAQQQLVAAEAVGDLPGVAARAHAHLVRRQHPAGHAARRGPTGRRACALPTSSTGVPRSAAASSGPASTAPSTSRTSAEASGPSSTVVPADVRRESRRSPRRSARRTPRRSAGAVTDRRVGRARRLGSPDGAVAPYESRTSRAAPDITDTGRAAGSGVAHHQYVRPTGNFDMPVPHLSHPSLVRSVPRKPHRVTVRAAHREGPDDPLRLRPLPPTRRAHDRRRAARTRRRVDRRSSLGAHRPPGRHALGARPHPRHVGVGAPGSSTTSRATA